MITQGHAENGQRRAAERYSRWVFEVYRYGN